jgi:hypothetical protein
MKGRVSLIGALMITAAIRWVSAYNIDSFTYEEMVAKSDLVVIARPSESRDTGEREIDRNVKPAVAVVGVVTECNVLYVLKGPKLKQFKLHHFREVNPRPPKGAQGIEKIVMGPQIGIAFDQSKVSHCYLMFLLHEADGRYAPFDGHTDVEGLSIQEVMGGSAD